MTEHPTRRVLTAVLLLVALVVMGCGGGSSNPAGAPAAGTSPAAKAGAASAQAACSNPLAATKGAGEPIPLVRMAATAPTSIVDPSQSFNQLTASPMFEGLMTLCPDGKVKPWLAESVSRPKPSVYVFHLRRGVKFWDGNEMTAADVVTSLQHAAEPKSPASSSYQNMKSVVATDPYTVTLTLARPDASFEQTLAWEGAIFEKSFYEAHKAKFGQPGTLIQATGPWQIVSFDPNTGAEYEANPHYWGGPVNIKHISIKYFADDTSAALAFRAGEIDVAFPTDGTAFASASGAKLQSVPATSLGLLGMNTKLPPWNDVHVRRAVAYALDRQALVKALGSPAFAVSTIILPAQLRTIASQAQVDALMESLPSYSYSIDKAKAELAQSRYPQGFSATFDTAKGWVASVPVSEAIGGMLGKIGIKLKVRVLDENAWINELVGPKKFGAVFTTFNIGSPDPSGYPSWILGSKATPEGGWNWANYGPPAMDALLQQGTSTFDPEKRLAVYAKILKMVAEDVPYVAVLDRQYNMAISPKFSWPGFNQNYGRTPWQLQLRATS